MHVSSEAKTISLHTLVSYKTKAVLKEKSVSIVREMKISKIKSTSMFVDN